MKLGNILKYSISFLAVFIASFLLSFYLRNNKLFIEYFSNTKTIIKFDTKSIDFGDIPVNKEVVTFFVYRNIGESPLKINNITSNCGCTIPRWSRKELAPGMKDSIMVKFDAKTPGYFTKMIYIQSNSKTSPDALYIEGNVVEDSKK